MSAESRTPKEKLIAGHVEERKGYLYWVLNIVENGKRKQKFVPTHMKAKGNKTKAKDLLLDVRREWTEKLKKEAEEQHLAKDDRPSQLFADFLNQWLAFKYKQATQQTLGKKKNEINTYAGYATNVKSPIGPYFRENPIPLDKLEKDDIKKFYEIQLARVKTTTVKHYHAVIHGALEYAVELKLIKHNPSDNISFPQESRFKGDYYSIEEVKALLEGVRGTKLEIPVVLAAFYGLRRSEVLGLRWSAFNFTNDVFPIRHTVTSCNVNGKKMLILKDKGKSQTSLRSLPLVPFLKEWLLEKKQEQQQNRALARRSYNQEYLDYLCVDELGTLITPGYVTSTFPKILKKNDLRPMKFHGLRHTCAALLAANGVGIEDIMAWLGHSDIKITSDFYLHLEFTAKIASASSLEKAYVPEMLPDKKESALEQELRLLQQQVVILSSQLQDGGIKPQLLSQEQKKVSCQSDN